MMRPYDSQKLYDLIIKYWTNYLDNLDMIKTLKELVDQDNRKNLEEKWKAWNLGNKMWKNKDLKEYFKGKLDFVVEPSIPIIWFGDIEKYFNENNQGLRIVSVGLNPSDNEFIDVNKKRSFHRFFDFTKDEEKNRYEKLDRHKALDQNGIETLIDCYNGYFDRDPYWDWFNPIRNVIKVISDWMKANGKIHTPVGYTSYKECVDYQAAVHIDCHTAIATNPTWSKLTFQRNLLRKADLFKEFLDFLDPNIILFSQGTNDDLPYLLQLLDPNMVYRGKDTNGKDTTFIKASFEVNCANQPLNEQGDKVRGFKIKGNDKERLLIFQHLRIYKPFYVGTDEIIINKQKKSVENILLQVFR